MATNYKHPYKTGKPAPTSNGQPVTPVKIQQPANNPAPPAKNPAPGLVSNKSLKGKGL